MGDPARLQFKSKFESNLNSYKIGLRAQVSRRSQNSICKLDELFRHDGGLGRSVLIAREILPKTHTQTEMLVEDRTRQRSVVVLRFDRGAEQ